MKIPKFVIPLLAIGMLFGGYYLRHAFTKPTTSVTFESSGSQRMVCTVEGVKCKGTANFFTRLYSDVQGISSIETVATEHRAVFTYDPKVISKEDIREIMERQILLGDGSMRQVFKCLSME